MRKRIGALGLAAVLMLAMLCPALAANGKAEFVIKGPSSVKAGESFTVTVELKDNPGFNAIGFTLTYDKDKMTCTIAEKGPLMGDMLSATNPAAAAGAIVTGASLDTMTGDGVAGKFTFTAKSDQSSLQFGLENITFGDANGSPIPYEVTNAASSSGVPSDPGGTIDPVSPATDPVQPVDPAPVDPTPVDPTPATQTGFTDTAGHWAEPYIIRATELGLFKGYPDGSFRPDQNVTRAQYVTVLYRMAGSPAVSGPSPFTDVGNQGREFQDAIAWGYEKGYVNGRTADTFDPAGSVTRQEAMKILFGYDGGQMGMAAMFTAVYDETYTDSGEIADWARDAMYWGVFQTIISGTSDTTLSPRGTATRAQLAKILTVYIDNQTNE